MPTFLLILICALVGAATGIGVSMLGWYSSAEWHPLKLSYPPSRAVLPACLGAAWGGVLAAWVVG